MFCSCKITSTPCPSYRSTSMNMLTSKPSPSLVQVKEIIRLFFCCCCWLEVYSCHHHLHNLLLLLVLGLIYRSRGVDWPSGGAFPRQGCERIANVRDANVERRSWRSFPTAIVAASTSTFTAAGTDGGTLFRRTDRHRPHWLGHSLHPPHGFDRVQRPIR